MKSYFSNNEERLPLCVSHPPHRSKPRSLYTNLCVGGGLVVLVLVTLMVSAGLGFLHMDPLFCPYSSNDKDNERRRVDLEDDDDSEVRLPFQESPDSLSRREELRQRFARISGYDALHDPDSFQYIAWEWLADFDKGMQTDDTIDERYVVTLLYLSTGGDNWSHHSCNVLTQDTICDESCPHSGVVCDDQQHVVRMDWMGSHVRRMTGSLVTEIGHLTHLTHLDFHKNHLEGTLPTELGLLTRLQSLNLHENQISGELPTSLVHLHELTFLDVSLNHFDFTHIPTILQSLTKLESLSMKHNRMVGTIPTFLGELTQLTFLSLLDNELSGTIPEELSHLTRLRDLQLEMNRLEGDIPDALEALEPTLTSLALWQNKYKLDHPVPEKLQRFLPLYSPVLLKMKPEYAESYNTKTT